MASRHWLFDRRLRVAMFLWALMALALWLKALPLGCEHSIFPVYAGGVQHWWHDQPLYINYLDSEGLDYYRYSPTFAILFTPIALLPEPLNEILWSLFSMIFLLVALHRTMQDVVLPFLYRNRPDLTVDDDQRLRDENHFLIVCLAVSGMGLWSAQSNALVLSLALMTLSAMMRDRWWTAAAWLAAAVFVKLWPIALALLLMAFWPRRLAPRFIAACAVLAAVPFLTRPPRVVLWQYHSWLTVTLHPAKQRWDGFRDAWTIWQEAVDLFGGDHMALVHQLGYLVVKTISPVLVFAWCALQWFRERKRRPLACSSTSSWLARWEIAPSGRMLFLIFSAWVIWVLLFGPATEQLTYGIIAPTAAYAVVASFLEKKNRTLTLLLALGISLFSMGDVETTVCRVVPFGEALLPLCVATLAGWLAWHERQFAGLVTDSNR